MVTKKKKWNRSRPRYIIPGIYIPGLYRPQVLDGDKTMSKQHKNLKHLNPIKKKGLHNIYVQLDFEIFLTFTSSYKIVNEKLTSCFLI